MLISLVEVNILECSIEGKMRCFRTTVRMEVLLKERHATCQVKRTMINLEAGCN